MARKGRNMNFITRSYAAMFSVWFRVDGVTLADIAREQGISKTYASKLLQPWINGGFIRVTEKPHRTNASTKTYRAQYAESFETLGYRARCEECHKEMLIHVWREVQVRVNTFYGRV